MESNRIIHSGKWIKFLGVAFFCFMLFPSSSQAFFWGKINSFSANQVVLSPDGKVMSTTKLYCTPDAYRMDGMPMGGKEGGKIPNLTFLGFQKLDKQYIYNHDIKVYFESQLDENDILRAAKAYKNPDSEQILGNEKVSGYECVKKEVTSTMTVMGTNITNTIILWKSDKFEMPLRTQDENGRIVEIRNIDTSEPSKKLFRRLPGYKKVDNMMAAMGMDFAAMIKQEVAEDDDDEEEQEKLEANSQNIEDFNIEGVRETLQEVLGADASPEEMARFEQMMGHMENQLKQTSMKEGAAQGLWAIVPKRPGDKIGQEIKTSGAYQAIMGTTASLQEVFTFYEKELVPQGWNDHGMYIQDGMGAFTLMTEEHMLVISYAENPGMEGNYKFFYNVKLLEMK